MAIPLVRWPTLKFPEFSGEEVGRRPGLGVASGRLQRSLCAGPRRVLFAQLGDAGPARGRGHQGRAPRRFPGPRSHPGCPPSPRSAAWPGWPGPPRAGKGSWGRIPPSAPRGPQSPRQAVSSTRLRAPGRPIPAAPSSTCAGRCPPSAPQPGEGRRPQARRPDGAGHFLQPAAVARDQRWSAPRVNSQRARLWTPTPCRLQI